MTNVPTSVTTVASYTPVALMQVGGSFENLMYRLADPAAGGHTGAMAVLTEGVVVEVVVEGATVVVVVLVAVGFFFGGVFDPESSTTSPTTTPTTTRPPTDRRR